MTLRYAPERERRYSAITVRDAKVIDRILAVSGGKETAIPCQSYVMQPGYEGWWRDEEKSIDISHHQSLS
jgi:hypothetical protein